MEDAIADYATPRRHFELNRFEITIERDRDVVVLEDVLDATDVGVLHIPFAQFTAALRQ